MTFLVDSIIFSIIVGAVVGFAAGYLGSIMVLEKMALVGDAMSHVALPGLALGIGILLYGDRLDALEAALFGDIAKVDLTYTLIAIAISLTVIFLTRFIYRKIVLSLISEELAIAKGINVAQTNLLYLLL